MGVGMNYELYHGLCQLCTSSGLRLSTGRSMVERAVLGEEVQGELRGEVGGGHHQVLLYPGRGDH